MKLSRSLLVALLGVAALVASCNDAPEDPIARLVSEMLEKRPQATDTRVLVLGFDGLDFNVIDPMIENGELPAFARMKREGAFGKLQTISPMLSPVIWTTIATGKSPAAHGVLDFVVEDPETGRILPVSSFERRAEAVWDILGNYGVTVGVVGYLASWPAEPVNGFMVSDRMKLLGFEYGRREDEERGRKVYPPELMDSLEPMVEKVGDITYDQLSRYLNVSEEEFKKTYARAPQPGNKVGNFRLYLAAAETYKKIGLHLWKTEKPRFQVTYFELFDASSHLFMPYTPPKMDHITEPDYEKYKGAVAEVCRYTDRTLQEAMEAADENTVIIVVSDHGFRSGPLRLKEGSEFHDQAAARWHRRYGVFLAWGKGVRAGAKVGGASVYDITPTVLGLMGFPLAEDMHPEGKFLAEAFEITPPERTVKTYERGRRERQIAALKGEDIEDDMILQNLEALGYIGGEKTASTHMNLAAHYMSEGQFEEARKELEVANRKDPGSARVQLSLGEVHVELREFEKARKWFQEAVLHDPDLTMARLRLALVLKKLGHPQRALEQSREAVKRDPENPRAHYQLGVLLLDSKTPEEGEKELREALSLEPDFPEARNRLGILLLGRKEFAEAETHFRTVVEFQPDYIRAWNNLGVALLRNAALSDMDPQEREETYDRAIETFTEILERFPQYQNKHKTYYNRALIYRFRGQKDLAFRDARRALELKPDYEEAKKLLRLLERK
ncbi:MAG: alkaline phosphatase family protein [Planctomycetota bacterium]